MFKKIAILSGTIIILCGFVFFENSIGAYSFEGGRNNGGKIGFSKKTFDETIIYSSEKYNIPLAFLIAVMRAESGFNIFASSPNGAIGLMQIMPETGRELKLNPYNPLSNIIAGAKYLRYCLRRFNDDPVIALACYNAGPGSIIKIRYKSGAIKYYPPDYKQTRIYILKVYNYYKYYSKILR